MLLDELREYHIILATASPRRRQLIKDTGISFSLFSKIETEENYPDHLRGGDIPEYLAIKKSNAFPKALSGNDILITADTVVCKDGDVLLKPMNPDEAKDILSRISGGSHFVYTGVCLRSVDKTKSFIATTEVKFSKLSDEEILYYVDNFKPYDKAGAYGIQEWIGYIGVEEIHGSYFNVMGMPVHRLYHELGKFIGR